MTRWQIAICIVIIISCIVAMVRDLWGRRHEKMKWDPFVGMEEERPWWQR